MIYFDNLKEPHKQIETINNWGRTLLYQCSDEEFEEFLDGKKVWQNDVLIDNENYEQEQAQKEAQRIAMLKLTRGDVFRALLQAKGVTREQVRSILNNMPATNQDEILQKEMALIDFDEALDFYRGNPLIDNLGGVLGISKQQLDEFFETNDYTKLITGEDNA